VREDLSARDRVEDHPAFRASVRGRHAEVALLALDDLVVNSLWMMSPGTRSIRLSVAVLGFISIAAGMWAMVAPHSFYDQAATYPPYNRHFIHDIGAFQIGLGSCLIAALAFADALLVVLIGNALGATTHLIGHIADRSIGGSSSDPFTFGGLAIVMIVLTLARWRSMAPD
jgi:hypothetical protein